jgi:hypothetical protein
MVNILVHEDPKIPDVLPINIPLFSQSQTMYPSPRHRVIFSVQDLKTDKNTQIGASIGSR